MAVREPVTLVVSAVAIVIVAAVPVVLGPQPGSTFSRAYTDLLHETILAPSFFIGCAFVLALEARWPAVTAQRLVSVGLAQDFIWLLVFASLRLGSLLALIAYLQALYLRHLSFMTIPGAAAWPGSCRLLAAFVISDLTGYFGHWLRHRIPCLWSFHAVHHSQPDLNMFTDHRYHIVDYWIGGTLSALPLFVFAVSVPHAVIYTSVIRWYTRLYHANIRSNFGPLRWILVSPQSHRIHHSIDPRHYDTNFGTLTCLWDRLFGTYLDGGDDYPPTGVADQQFPRERTWTVRELVVTPIRQHLYPLRRFIRPRRPASPTSGRPLTDQESRAV